MKILHIIDHSLPLHSGYTFRSQSIFRAQKKRGWNPVIVTSPKHEENWKGEWHPRETIDDFHYYRCGKVNKGLPFLTERRMMKVIEDRIIQVADQEKPDILHAHSPVTLFQFIVHGEGVEVAKSGVSDSLVFAFCLVTLVPAISALEKNHVIFA